MQKCVCGEYPTLVYKKIGTEVLPSVHHSFVFFNISEAYCFCENCKREVVSNHKRLNRHARIDDAVRKWDGMILKARLKQEKQKTFLENLWDSLISDDVKNIVKHLDEIDNRKIKECDL